QLFAVVAFVFCAAKGIKNSQHSIADFNYAIEITTRPSLHRTRLPGPLQLKHTVGRTRQTLVHSRSPAMESSGVLSNSTEVYCCFWLYPNHPALPEEWEHRAEYPFDFVYHGNFLKNERN
ncbi:hypothetical protein KR093_002234, partial [Drosophila rubida]